MYQLRDKRQGVVLPKAWRMGRSLQLMRGIGEKAWNMEVLGLFRIFRGDDGFLSTCFVEDP